MSNNDYNKVTASSVSVGNWMWTILLSHIPLVDLIMYLVTALHSKKPSKRNWAVAYSLLNVFWKIVGLVVTIVILTFAFSKLDIVSYINETPITDFSASDFIMYIAEQCEDEEASVEDIISESETIDSEDAIETDDEIGEEIGIEDTEDATEENTVPVAQSEVG